MHYSPQSAEIPQSELPTCVLQEEERFYSAYSWSLNPYLTFAEAGQRLGAELDRLDAVPGDWRRREILTNVYLLACAMLTAVDDYLRGPAYHLPRVIARAPFAGFAFNSGESVAHLMRRRVIRQIREWRYRAVAGLEPFLQLYCNALGMDVTIPQGAGSSVAEAYLGPFPADLAEHLIPLPSCFRKLDLTPHDIVALSREFISRFPDRRLAILAVGLRTAGSYIAPLFKAVLQSHGYKAVEMATFRADKGLGREERSKFGRFAAESYRAVLLDDPPVSGETVSCAIDELRRLGFPDKRLAVVLPIQFLRRYRLSPMALDLPPEIELITLAPENWHKRRLLAPGAVERRLAEYFQGHGYARAEINVHSAPASLFNAKAEGIVEDDRRNRLKQVFEVRLATKENRNETRFVLVKSVGYGYLSYHAYLAGRQLRGLVPPLLGLRDGLLFVEWLPQGDATHPNERRGNELIATIASYIATRIRGLSLRECGGGVRRHKYSHGVAHLAKVLSRAYGDNVTARLMRKRIERRLVEQPCPRPTLIDGKMRPVEWIADQSSLLKTDFEHHGMGKGEVNVIEPAYDLADAIFQFGLSSEEEGELINRYQEEACDPDIGRRLFIYKLMAGSWAMADAVTKLQHRYLAGRQQQWHREFVDAWHFLTAQTARHCGQLCGKSRAPGPGSPLLVLDVDGVIDRRIFGFPSPTAASIEGIAMLHAHGFPIVLNTARSVREVTEYCAAYDCVGAVAEYGAFVWDGVEHRGRALLSPGSLRELTRAREALGRLPGVFIDENYKYSMKAYTYEGGTPVPLPTPLVLGFLEKYDLTGLTFHQTSIDTTIVSAEVNKGNGLIALLELMGKPGAETLAIGDSEPDLAMFRASGRSFAPGHIICKRQARLLGCSISPHPFQRGFLSIVRAIVHPDGGTCDLCRSAEPIAAGRDDLVIDLLRVADERPWWRRSRALFHPTAIAEIFSQ
jgi:hydroxymethylpyrimidine pyrophosphatase-like HAD family hydrolase